MAIKLSVKTTVGDASKMEKAIAMGTKIKK